jgi:UPF0716 protein FxsA
MLLRMILLLTIIPVIEITLILRVHEWLQSHFGDGTALLISVGTIVFTGVLGANLAKREGLQVLQKAQSSASNGEPLGSVMQDGLMVFVGGALLLTPGYLTDIFGLTLIFPATRYFYRSLLSEWFNNQMKNGRVKMNFQGQGDQFSQHFSKQSFHSEFSDPKLYHSNRGQAQPSDVIDIEAVDCNDESKK